MRYTLPAVLLSAAIACSGADHESRPGVAEIDRATPAAGQAGGRKIALLVGCTKYDKLAENFWLHGPGNDVVLMRKVLTERFGFADRDIVTLAEGPRAAGRPTRANIQRQFDRLAREARPGDQIVIVLGGHGSQQPDQEPFDEPDGLDETFLPCDAGPWDGSKLAVHNAIIDDEMEVWTRAITDKGAALFLILDSCHSGTMARDIDPVEVLREIPEGKLVPLDVLQKARAARPGGAMRHAADQRRRPRSRRTRRRDWSRSMPPSRTSRRSSARCRPTAPAVRAMGCSATPSARFSRRRTRR